MEDMENIVMLGGKRFKRRNTGEACLADEWGGLQDQFQLERRWRWNGLTSQFNIFYTWPSCRPSKIRYSFHIEVE